MAQQIQTEDPFEIYRLEQKGNGLCRLYISQFYHSDPNNARYLRGWIELNREVAKPIVVRDHARLKIMLQPVWPLDIVQNRSFVKILSKFLSLKRRAVVQLEIYMQLSAADPYLTIDFISGRGSVFYLGYERVLTGVRAKFGGAMFRAFRH
jgi:hypothetical protein